MRHSAALCLTILVLWLSRAEALAEQEGLPEPLGLQQALSYADRHPRASLGSQAEQRYPQRRPLYLDCHELAYSSTAGLDYRGNRIGSAFISPGEVQRLAIMEHFFDVLLADLSYARYNEAMAVAYIQFDRAGARRDLGQYSELQVLELEAVYQDIRQRQASSVLLQRLTRSQLAQSVNHPLSLPRDLTPPQLPGLPDELPDLGRILQAAKETNRWLADLKAGTEAPERRLLDLELRQQALELVLRLEGLKAARQYAVTESLRRDLKLDESRTLYEQEVKSDLGYSMSQQTLARLREQRVAYCQALAWAELNALQGEPVWPLKQSEDDK